MNYVFLGSYFPKDKVEEITGKSIGPIANANNLWQWNFIHGLGSLKLKLCKYTFPQIGAFPNRYKGIFFHGTSTCGSFINLPLVKHLDRYLRTYKKVDSILKSYKGNTVVFIYDLYIPFIYAILILKRKYSIKVCLIVPDLIGFTGSPNCVFYKWKEDVERKMLSKVISKIDYFVLLTQYMAEPLRIKEKPYIVVEGMYNDVFKDIANIQCDKVLFYSGALDERNGVKHLVEAFNLLPKDYKLVICGDGTLKEWICKASAVDNRIVYKGQLLHQEVLRLQLQSSLLVNPRKSTGIFTKYSFPSKTLEYFASGVPVLMYKLKGIPAEYYNYCFTPEDESAICLANKIVEIHSMERTKLNKIGLDARNFILQNKTPEKQIARIIKMIYE